ncbi:hypothetical protein CSOJ01_10887 [Colletotrichum sojae]|uniref:Uncharacterized protein n=1 Tax=Colletotrichum sojae TaxID=2175907 RepID=A0A8H6IZ50_9PEZI|nr:hypothetical protein CSOJ01_10887 [Colletotrichum sojae]
MWQNTITGLFNCVRTNVKNDDKLCQDIHDDIPDRGTELYWAAVKLAEARCSTARRMLLAGSDYPDCQARTHPGLPRQRLELLELSLRRFRWSARTGAGVGRGSHYRPPVLLAVLSAVLPPLLQFLLSVVQWDTTTWITSLGRAIVWDEAMERYMESSLPLPYKEHTVQNADGSPGRKDASCTLATPPRVVMTLLEPTRPAQFDAQPTLPSEVDPQPTLSSELDPEPTLPLEVDPEPISAPEFDPGPTFF